MPIALAIRTIGEKTLWRDGRGRETIPYVLPHEYYDRHFARSHIPTHYLRGVNYALHSFAVESFIDELAHAGGHNPLDFRIALTEQMPDRQRVLKVLKEVSGYTTDLPRGEGMGVCHHNETETPAAGCATVSVSKRGRLQIEKFTVVLDPGHLLDPRMAEQQIKSAIAFELSSVLYGGADIRDGRVRNTNFDSYPIVRIDEMPEVEVHFALEGGKRWGGLGEIGAGIVGPTIGNAIFAATGIRVRSTPIKNHDLKWS